MEKTLIKTIHDTMWKLMAEDERVLVVGEDVGIRGGVFRATEGFLDKFGEERVIDTPLAESSIVGHGIGMALGGLLPIIEIQFADFIHPAFNQIVQEAARMRYRSNGDFSCPIVIRAPYGAGVHGGLYHSQSVEALFAHVPGLKIVLPSTPYDAEGLAGDLPVRHEDLQSDDRLRGQPHPRRGGRDQCPHQRGAVLRPRCPGGSHRRPRRARHPVLQGAGGVLPPDAGPDLRSDAGAGPLLRAQASGVSASSSASSSSSPPSRRSFSRDRQSTSARICRSMTLPAKRIGTFIRPLAWRSRLNRTIVAPATGSSRSKAPVGRAGPAMTSKASRFGGW